MKNVILYCLIFSVLFNIFQYVNANKILDAKDKEVSKVRDRLKTSRESVATLVKANYFSLENDQDAQEYFYKGNLDYLKVTEKVTEDLLALNDGKKGNKLIPYEAIDGKAFLVNTSKLLNHRWLVAEYSNGDLWGQILVKYFVEEGKPTDFETVETVLYDKQKQE